MIRILFFFFFFINQALAAFPAPTDTVNDSAGMTLVDQLLVRDKNEDTVPGANITVQYPNRSNVATPSFAGICDGGTRSGQDCETSLECDGGGTCTAGVSHCFDMDGSTAGLVPAFLAGGDYYFPVPECESDYDGWSSVDGIPTCGTNLRKVADSNGDPLSGDPSLDTLRPCASLSMSYFGGGQAEMCIDSSYGAGLTHTRAQVSSWGAAVDNADFNYGANTWTWNLNSTQKVGSAVVDIGHSFWFVGKGLDLDTGVTAYFKRGGLGNASTTALDAESPVERCGQVRTIVLALRDADGDTIALASGTYNVGLRINGSDTSALCSLTSSDTNGRKTCNLTDISNAWSDGGIITVWGVDGGSSPNTVNYMLEVLIFC